MSLGSIGIGAAQRGPDLLQADAILVQSRRIQFDPNTRKRASAHGHLSHAAYLGQFLRHDGRGGVVHLAPGENGRSESQHEDGRVGRIHFAVRRVVGKIGWQVAAGGVDGGLYIARGRVDVAIQIELQRDAGRSEGARRGHLGDRRDASELALEGRRHR